MRRLRPLAALALALPFALAPAAPAAAHHGWEHYETTTPFYASGTVADVAWGNPHPEVTLRVDSRRVPPGWTDRELPAELEDIGGREVLAATRAHPGDSTRLTLVLAPVERLSAWGLEGRLETGERLQVVGYPDRDHDDELRPELIVRADGRVIRQRSVPLPEPPAPASAPAGGAASAPASAGSSSGRSSAVPSSGRPSAVTVWLLTGGGLLLVVVAGGFHVVRRAGRTAGPER
ncbi:hypothetical protein [Streptomyces sp. JB150]|uniref:hypothetical protein n=1 Tax=Streptomyces sp. JB150 TaxID=2714844 RepID=UPI001407261D|nr:hypothetical protein [Streptomyces sp. JB150]QIJ60583.1 hypothetical protein G7Z13_10700 [Streptomyces sp. JB150]